MGDYEPDTILSSAAEKGLKGRGTRGYECVEFINVEREEAPSLLG